MQRFLFVLAGLFLMGQVAFSQDTAGTVVDPDFDFEEPVITSEAENTAGDTDDDFDFEEPAITSEPGVTSGAGGAKSAKPDVGSDVFKSISGTVNYSQTSGSTNKRQYGVLNLRFDKDFGSFRLVLEGLAEAAKITIKQKLNQNYCVHSVNNCSKYAKERSLTHKKSQGKLEEAYVAYEANSVVTLSGGKKKVIWGQFEPFSPSNFAFPLNLVSTGVKFSKFKSALGQNFVGVNLYPTSFMSLEAYFFPQITADDIATKSVTGGRTDYGQPKIINPTKNNINLEDKTVKGSIPSGKKGHQYGGRILFYTGWGTLGVSAFNGYDTLNPLSFRVIKKLKDSNGTDFTFGANTAATATAPAVKNNFRGFDNGKNYYYTTTLPSFGRQRMVSLELAIPYGQFIFKAEWARYDKTVAISNYDSAVISPILNGATAPPGYQGNYNDAQEFVKWINDNNDGRLYAPATQDFVAVGFDYNSDSWLINFALFNSSESVKPKYKRIVDLQKTAFPLHKDSSAASTFPLVNVVYYHNSDKSNLTGLAAGIIGNGSGVALYHSREFLESITLGVALQAVQYFSDNQLEDIGGGDKVYKNPGGMSTGVTAGVGYKF